MWFGRDIYVCMLLENEKKRNFPEGFAEGNDQTLGKELRLCVLCREPHRSSRKEFCKKKKKNFSVLS
jgi:hypothetical protein